MPDKVTLNRFPLFGLFAYRAALRMGPVDIRICQLRVEPDGFGVVGYGLVVFAMIAAASSYRYRLKELQERGREKEMQKLGKQGAARRTGRIRAAFSL